jgi:hypothetical protein
MTLSIHRPFRPVSSPNVVKPFRGVYLRWLASNTALWRGYGNASTEQGGYRKNRNMKKTGMILLALYLIIDGLLGLGVNFGPLVMLLYPIAIVAGVIILLGALKSSG